LVSGIDGGTYTVWDRVLRRIFGSTKDEVTGGWRELHNEELHDLRFSTDKSRDQDKEDEIGRVCTMNGDEVYIYISYIRF
jgi:PAS domain-containing protein